MEYRHDMSAMSSMFILVYTLIYLSRRFGSAIPGLIRLAERSATAGGRLSLIARSCAIISGCVRGFRPSSCRPRRPSSRDEVRRIFQELGPASAGHEALTGECAPAAGRLRDRRNRRDRRGPAGRRSPRPSASSLKGGRAHRRGDKTPRRGRRRLELSPGRARLRPLRAGGPRLGRRATRARARATLVDGELRIVAAQASPSAAAARIRIADQPTDRRGRRVMRLLFIGDIVGTPGPRPRAPRRCRRSSTYHADRPRDRQRRERRRRASASRAKSATQLLDCGRGRHDVGQSHLGQEGSDRLHRHRAAPAAPGQLPRRRARATAATSRATGDGRVGRRRST